MQIEDWERSVRDYIEEIDENIEQRRLQNMEFEDDGGQSSQQARHLNELEIQILKHEKKIARMMRDHARIMRDHARIINGRVKS
jgi:hypothetical protein